MPTAPKTYGGEALKRSSEGLARLDLVFTVLAMLGFASAFPVTKVALRWVQPVTLAALRTVVAAAVLVPLALMKPPLKNQNRKRRRVLTFAFGFFGFYVGIVLQNYGLNYTGAALASILQSPIPIFMALLAFLFLREPITSNKAMGSTVALVGVVFLTANANLGGVGDTFNLGNLLIVASALSIAGGSLFAKFALAREGVLTLMVWSLGAAGLLLVPTASLLEHGGILNTLGLEGWAAVTYLAVVPSAASNLLIYDVLSRVDLSKLAFFGFLVPVFATVISTVFLGEFLSLYQVAFSLMVVVGVMISQR